MEGLDSGLNNFRFSFMSPKEKMKKKCELMLKDSIHSKDKVESRKRLLERQPELRRTINTVRLKDIIDYEAFKCNPNSSVARNQAIEGSDIDGGLVITENPVSEEEKLKFVEELRSQGFDVTSPMDYEEIYNQIQYANPEDITNLTYQADHIKSRMITFSTQDILETKAKENPFQELSTVVYIAGSKIE